MQKRLWSGLTLAAALGTLAACGTGGSHETAVSSVSAETAALSASTETSPSLSLDAAAVGEADFAFVQTDLLNGSYRYLGPRPTSEKNTLYFYNRDEKKWTTVSAEKIVSGQIAYGQDTLYLPLENKDVEVGESGVKEYQRSSLESLANLLVTDKGVAGYSDSSMTDDAGKMSSFVLTKEKGQVPSYKSAGAEIYTADSCGSQVWGRVLGEQRTLNEVPTSTTETLLESLKEPITFARLDDVAASKKSFTPEQNHRVVGQVLCDGQKLYQLVNIYAEDSQLETSDPAQTDMVILESAPVAINILVFDTASGEFSEIPVPSLETPADFSYVAVSAYDEGKLWLVDLSGKVFSLDTTSGELTQELTLELAQDLMSEQENAFISDGKLVYFNASDPAKPLLYTYDLESASLESKEELPALTSLKAGEFSLGDILSLD